jgi:hypothetical protein
VEKTSKPSLQPQNLQSGNAIDVGDDIIMEHHFEKIQDPPIDVTCLLYNHKILQLKCKVRNIPNHNKKMYLLCI